MQYTLPVNDDALPKSVIDTIPGEWFDLTLFQSNDIMMRYCRDCAIDTYNRLELGSKLQNYQSAEKVMELCQYAPGFRYALVWIFRVLASDKLLSTKEIGGTVHYKQETKFPQTETQALFKAAIKINANNLPMLKLLDAAIQSYPDIAEGHLRGEEALLGLNHLQLWLDFFQNDNPLYAINNRIAAFAAVDAIEGLDEINILEFGAGAGSGSEALLDELSNRNIIDKVAQYWVTEPNAFFHRKGARLLADKYPDIEIKTGQLDINKPWSEQLGNNRFDLIYSVNTLHVSYDIGFVLEQAKPFLQGGWFVAGECIRPFPEQAVYTEMMFQVLDSFIDVKLDDKLRPNPGFLTPEQWLGWFKKHQYRNVSMVPNIKKIRTHYSGFISAAICGQFG